MRHSDRLFATLGSVLLGLAWLVASWLAEPDPRVPIAHVRVKPIALPVAVRTAALASGDTLSGLLARLGVPREELQAWLGAAQRVLNPRALPTGLVAEATLDYHGALKAIRLTPDWRASVVLEKHPEGVASRKEERPVTRELRVVRGTITSSLFEAMQDAGEDETVAIELAELFQWDIDFHREVQKGDTFSFLVERVLADGKAVAYGPIVAAEYVNAGKRYASVRYAVGGQNGYYDLLGRPLKKQFLRAPLRFSRVTSRFTVSRLHPVLGVRLPHWGVDYGAPVGTPVMATADGVVITAGRNGGAGNQVEIRHAGGFVTGYMHLSRFGAGVHAGAHVGQGQVIGFVGSTGLSTGPHLDYRVSLNGRHLNPMTVGKEPSPPLGGRELAAFKMWSDRVLPLLAAPGTLQPPTVTALRDGSPVRFDA